MKVILIVDDDPAIRRMLPKLLSGAGLQFLAASDWREAEAILSSRPVDLVLLDVVLGPENGWEALRQLRERSAVPVILMTGGAVGEDILADARALGAQGVLAKPFDAGEFLRSIVDALPRRP